MFLISNKLEQLEFKYHCLKQIWAIPPTVGNVPVFLKICTDLQEICSISSQNCFCYCFCSKNCSSKFRSRHSTVLLLFLLRNLLKQSLKLFRNNDKNNFASKCCNFFANLCKSSEILEQCHVNWWLDYRIWICLIFISLYLQT